MGQNLSDDILARLRSAPYDAAVARWREGRWETVSIAALHADITAVAQGLLASGITPGDRVALLSSTRYEWTVFDYALWWIGAVTVPVYETSSPEQIDWILSDAGAVAAVVETPEHLRRLPDRPGPVWVIENGALDALRAAGLHRDTASLERARAAVGPEAIATIIYTSGTTGRPKGCVLTHGNFMAELDGAVDALDELFGAEDASTLLFLPLAHVFARIVQIGALRSGTTLALTSDVKHLTTHLGEFSPSFLLAVPRVFEKVFNTASQNAWASGRGRLFDAAADTAIAYSRALDKGRVGPLLRARHALYDRLVYRTITAALGGRVRYAISGGAPLGERLAHFYRGIGVTILEGYGLTETTAAVSVNRPGAVRIGSVGPALRGAQIRIAADGEVLVRGRQVFGGYWNAPEATAEVLDPEGWFHTGDLGDLDPDGCLRITGRKKEILVTAGGKNVAPAVLEDRVRAHPWVSQCLVVGDGKPFVSALVTIDTDSYRGSLTAPELTAAVQEAVDEANKAVSQAESIRKFAIVPEDWTEANGYLTPSFKLKRNLITADLHDRIEALYTS